MSQTALTLRETRGTIEGWAVSAEEGLRDVVRQQRARIVKLEAEVKELREQLREAEGVADLNRRRRA